MDARQASIRNYFTRSELAHVGFVKFAVWGILGLAASITLVVSILLALFHAAKFVAGQFGLESWVSELGSDIRKDIVLVIAGVSVALIALYGVIQQNLSAERRHRIDAGQALKKDIFLRAAEACAMQATSIMSYADPAVTPRARQKMLVDANKAFYRVQMVSSPEVIEALLDSNKYFMIVTIKVQILCATPPADPIQRVIDIQELLNQFLEKLYKFNAVARDELGTAFPDNDAYYLMMKRKIDEIPEAIRQLVRGAL